MIELTKLKKHPKLSNKQTAELKKFWSNRYCHWSDEKFKERLRIKRKSFEYILASMRPMILKQPTTMSPDPIEDHRQLTLTIYRLVHGCSFKVLRYLFGVSQSVATETFKQVIRVIVSCLYNEFVYLPRSDEEWRTECKSFIENYEFPCVDAWDGFHVNVATKLKNYYSFKNKYTVSSMRLIGHNKRFLHLTTGAPGSMHDPSSYNTIS